MTPEEGAAPETPAGEGEGEGARPTTQEGEGPRPVAGDGAVRQGQRGQTSDIFRAFLELLELLGLACQTV
jgi:hypothetical protein